MIITTTMTTLAMNMCLIAAPVYGVIKGIDYGYQTMMNKDKPITVIKFDEWKRVAQ